MSEQVLNTRAEKRGCLFQYIGTQKLGEQLPTLPIGVPIPRHFSFLGILAGKIRLGEHISPRLIHCTTSSYRHYPIRPGLNFLEATSGGSAAPFPSVT